MRDEILNYIRDEYSFGSSNHSSACMFPGAECSCFNKKINHDTDLWSEGYIDSFSLASLVLFLEVRYEFIVPQKLITQDNFRSVDSIIKMIDNGYARSESKDDPV